MPRRITQADLAKATGLSRSTVAKALTMGAEASELSATTRRLVRDTAVQLGYRGASGRSIALIGADPSAWRDPFLPEALAALAEAGLRVTITPWMEAGTALVGSSAVIAVAFIPAGLAELAAAHGLPCLALNATGGKGTSCIRSDEASDLTHAVSHLAGLGHRRLCLAYSTGTFPHFSVAERRRAAAAEASRLGLHLDEMPLNDGDDDLLRLMTAADGPTALILAPVDTHPWRLLEARRRRAFALVAVGKDLRNSPVTSIQPDYCGVARALARACQDDGAPGDILLPGRLVVRDTSTPPPAP